MTEDRRGEEPLPTTLAPPAAPRPAADWSRVRAPPAPASSFGLGELIARSFATWGRNAPRFALPGALSSVPMAVVSYRMYSLMEAFDPARAASDPYYSLSANPIFVFWRDFLVGWLVSIVLVSLSMAAVTEGAARALRRERVRLGAMLAVAFRRAMSVLGVVVLISLATLATACTVVVPFFLLVAWSVAVPAAVVEGAGPVRALGRSWALTRDHRWSLFAGYAVVSICAVLAAGAFQGVSSGVMLGGMGQGALRPGPGLGLSMAVYQIVAGVLGTVTMVACAVAHHGLRGVKEGNDPVLLAQVFE